MTLLLGALAIGVVALLADGLGASAQHVLFSGQASIPGLVGEDSTRIVIVLLAAKALAYAICLGRLPGRPGVPGDLPRRRGRDGRSDYV